MQTSYLDGLKARKAFDEALQREHGGGDGGEEFRKKVTESLEGLDRKGRKEGYSDLCRCLQLIHRVRKSLIGLVNLAP